MSTKSRNRKPSRPAMSPLLRALTFSRAAHEPITRAMLLQGYASLDAFRRGHGSRELFTTLARQLLVAEELSRLGHFPDEIGNIEQAHAAMMQLDRVEKENAAWVMEENDYGWLCVALAAFDHQLAEASLEDIAKAEARMVEALMRTERHAVFADASA